MKLIRDKNRIVEGVVYTPEVGKTYWFNTNGGIRKGVYKGSTKSWHIFSTEDGSNNMYVKLWSNIATSREDLEEINGVVDKMARDTYVPDVVHLPNRFTR